MNCFITGINGFVGSYLAEFLLENNCRTGGMVRSLDKIENILHIKDHLYLAEADLSNIESLKKGISEFKPDIIFHLAGQSNVPLSWQKARETIETNVIGTLNLLYAVKNSGLNPRLVIISTGDLYKPIFTEIPVDETFPVLPQNPYATSKYTMEFLVHQFGRYFGLDYIILRPFSHIGPRQVPNFVMSDFCIQIALIEKGVKFPVMKVGNLRVKRDYTDVRDVVRAYWLIAEKGRIGEVYNVASGKCYNLGDLLNRLIEFSSVSIRIEIDRTKFRSNDIPIKLGSAQKLHGVTGWKPEIPIEQTLKDVLEWWRKKADVGEQKSE